MKLNDISSYLDVKNDRYRAIFFDLDGTLLNSKKEITDICIRYLYHLKIKYDFHFGIASGRNISSIIPIIVKYQLQDLFDVVVANNGADLFLLNEGLTVEVSKICGEKVKEILEKFSSVKGVTVFFHNPKYLFSTKITDEIIDIQKKNYEKEILNPCIYKNYELPSRVVLQADNLKILQKIKNTKISDLKRYHSEPLIYEYVSPDVSKSNGILKYLERYKKNLDDVLVFGDGDNDIEMLKDCKYGIAMKNGTNAALQIADEVTEYTNDQEGIVRFFKKYIKEENDGKFYL